MCSATLKGDQAGSLYRTGPRPELKPEFGVRSKKGCLPNSLATSSVPERQSTALAHPYESPLSQQEHPRKLWIEHLGQRVGVLQNELSAFRQRITIELRKPVHGPPDSEAQASSLVGQAL